LVASLLLLAGCTSSSDSAQDLAAQLTDAGLCENVEFVGRAEAGISYTRVECSNGPQVSVFSSGADLQTALTYACESGDLSEADFAVGENWFVNSFASGATADQLSSALEGVFVGPIGDLCPSANPAPAIDSDAPSMPSTDDAVTILSGVRDTLMGGGITCESPEYTEPPGPWFALQLQCNGIRVSLVDDWAAYEQNLRTGWCPTTSLEWDALDESASIRAGDLLVSLDPIYDGKVVDTTTGSLQVQAIAAALGGKVDSVASEFLAAGCARQGTSSFASTSQVLEQLRARGIVCDNADELIWEEVRVKFPGTMPVDSLICLGGATSDGQELYYHVSIVPDWQDYADWAREALCQPDYEASRQLHASDAYVAGENWFLAAQGLPTPDGNGWLDIYPEDAQPQDFAAVLGGEVMTQAEFYRERDLDCPV
jgi:hypothetical protein